MFRKIVAVWVSLAMLFGFVVIVDVVTDITPPVEAITITVDNSGGADYLTIQEGIDAASPGDTVFVYNGTYYENVVVDETINLTGEDKNTTTVNANSSRHGIYVQADWVNITGFTVTNSASGAGGYGGILIYNVTNCRVFNNVVVENQIGIYIWSSSNNTITNNSVSDNLAGIDARYKSDNIIITSNDISGNYHGIFVYSSSNHNINGNDVSDCEGGIVIVNSTGVAVMDNTLSNTSGILSRLSANITISHNVINSGFGKIQIESSSNISLLNNNISKGDKYGIYFESSVNSTVLFNNVSSHSQNGIYFLTSSNYNISYNEILDNGGGICIIGSTNGSMFRNKLLNNWVGFHIGSSSYNTITYNDVILHGYYGIDTSSGYSHNNTIYHNNFYGNKYNYDGSQAADWPEGNNRWDNGYPGGGNYWSDYDGFDNYNGPNQDILGGDGIGDTPYFTDYDGTPDNYPLMEPNPDSLHPRILLISPDNNSIIRPGITLDYQVIEGNLNSAKFSVDGGFEQSFVYPYDISTNGWAEGLHTVLISAQDISGNSAINSTCFIVDSTKPLISLLSPENNTEFQDGRVLDFSIIDTHLMEVTYSINSESNISFLSPFDISTSGWSDGDYTVHINARDFAGNQDSKWFLFKIDSIPPVITNITLNPPLTKLNGYVNITVSVSDLGEISDAWLGLTDPNGDYLGNFSLAYDPATKRYYMNQTFNLVGTYQYIIWIGDNSRNWNSSTGVFTVSKTPNPPIDLTAIAGDSYVYLTWTAPATIGDLPITNYLIYRSEIINEESFLIEVGNTTYYNDTTVTNGVTYYYKVRAFNLAGEGPKSTEVYASPHKWPDAKESQDAQGLWWFLLILVILISLIILFLLFHRREENQPTPPVEDAIFPSIEIIKCPWCDHNIEVFEDQKSMVIHCPNCGKERDLNW